MTGEPPVRYHIDAARRNVYAVDKHGTYTRINITPDELERQMALALQHQRDYDPSLDKPKVGSTIPTR